jgi:hypothetical protein
VKKAVQWLAVRNTFAVIIVPEQMGKISPVVDDFTINAPVLRNVLFESTNPYVIAEARGETSNNDPTTKLRERAKKQMSRFIFESPFMKALRGLSGCPILHPPAQCLKARLPQLTALR